LRRAVELAPADPDPLFALIQSLERARGPLEGQKLDEAFQLAVKARALGPLSASRHKLLRDVFVSVCAHEKLAGLGSFADVGRAYARSGLHTALFRQIAQARAQSDKRELLEQHRIWGRMAEDQARRSPISPPPPPPLASPDQKIRLGFLSSDLRRHPVGYFAAPLFDHPDERFELYIYSFSPWPADDLQSRISAGAKAYHQWPRISAKEAAQRISGDRLDVLIELGGSTDLNKITTLCYRPAPIQASWLGYPMSSGLDNIDYFICDDFNRPNSSEWLIEKPLILPKSWVSLGEGVLAEPPISEPPSLRNGFVTFGTANQPHKYTPEVLRAWARILAATPNSRYLFIRPECASAVFRANIMEAFRREGVQPDRIIWRPVRGRHLSSYNEMDISLDTFPLTGGTTTVDSLWMGVPVISLFGEMFHERLSHSLLSNVGLSDLSVGSIEAYEAAAIALANDGERRTALRRGLRGSLKSGPIGRTEAFAADFYSAVHDIVDARRSSLQR